MKQLYVCIVCGAICVLATEPSAGAEPSRTSSCEAQEHENEHAAQHAREALLKLRELVYVLRERMRETESADARDDAIREVAAQIVLSATIDMNDGTKMIWAFDRLSKQNESLAIGDSVGFDPDSYLVWDIRRRSAILVKVDGTFWEWDLGTNLANVRRVQENEQPPVRRK